MKIPILGNHHKIEFPIDRSHPKHVRIEYIQGIQIYPQNYHHNGLDIDSDQTDNMAGSGFLASALSSVVTSGIGIQTSGWKQGAKTAMILGGGLTGGLGSVIGGGDFWEEGAKNGLIVAGLNHVAHEVEQSIQDRKFYKNLLEELVSLNKDTFINDWGEEVFNSTKFRYKKIINFDPSIGAGTEEIGRSNKRYFGFRGSKTRVFVSRRALNDILSNPSRAFTWIGHEMSHVSDLYYGITAYHISILGEYRAGKLSEYRAYSKEYQLYGSGGQQRYGELLKFILGN